LSDDYFAIRVIRVLCRNIRRYGDILSKLGHLPKLKLEINLRSIQRILHKLPRLEQRMRTIKHLHQHIHRRFRREYVGQNRARGFCLSRLLLGLTREAADDTRYDLDREEDEHHRPAGEPALLGALGVLGCLSNHQL
jgi:hypothetical protein